MFVGSLDVCKEQTKEKKNENIRWYDDKNDILPHQFIYYFFHFQLFEVSLKKYYSFFDDDYAIIDVEEDDRFAKDIST